MTIAKAGCLGKKRSGFDIEHPSFHEDHNPLIDDDYRFQMIRETTACAIEPRSNLSGSCLV